MTPDEKMEVIRRALLILLSDDRSPARPEIIEELRKQRWI